MYLLLLCNSLQWSANRIAACSAFHRLSRSPSNSCINICVKEITQKRCKLYWHGYVWKMLIVYLSTCQLNSSHTAITFFTLKRWYIAIIHNVKSQFVVDLCRNNCVHCVYVYYCQIKSRYILFGFPGLITLTNGLAY